MKIFVLLPLLMILGSCSNRESKLIGYWASDFKKTLENLKVLKANATDDFVKEKIYGAQIKEFEEGTNRDSWPVAMQTKFIIQFTKDGKMKAFAKGSEIIGTYSIIDTEDGSLSWRLDGGIGGSEGLFITLDGDTLQLSPPPDPASNPFPILFSRTEEPPAAKLPE